jgi:pimeloyl-ACP methyl ester carboxylesterase
MIGMPASMSANLIGEYIEQAQIKIYEKAAHGLYLTHADQVLKEILAFVSAVQKR